MLDATIGFMTPFENRACASHNRHDVALRRGVAET
jgi:hypothetical protein